MRWRHPGHEFDIEYGRIKPLIQRAESGFWLFGAGNMGDFVGELYKLFTDIHIKGYIDNIRSGEKNGIPVISFENWIVDHVGEGILIAVSNEHYDVVFTQLSSAGLTAGNDFFDSLRFMELYLLYKKKRLYIPSTQISVTERCTLRCKKCAHACNLVPATNKDLSEKDVLYTTDEFFKVVDYCEEFALIGGETLLYQGLPNVIGEIGVKYRDRMRRFTLTTNGTIEPNQKLLDVCYKNRIEFYISNYVKAVPRLKNKIQNICDKLDANSIKYHLESENYDWMDYGFDYVNRHGSEAELITVFDKCKTVCQESRYNKFYFCVQARAVSENMHLNIGLDDYLDMDSLDGLVGKKMMYEFVKGYSKKGYLDMCNYCNGADAYLYPIPAGQQENE